MAWEKRYKSESVNTFSPGARPPTWLSVVKSSEDNNRRQSTAHTISEAINHPSSTHTHTKSESFLSTKVEELVLGEKKKAEEKRLLKRRSVSWHGKSPLQWQKNFWTAEWENNRTRSREQNVTGLYKRRRSPWRQLSTTAFVTLVLVGQEVCAPTACSRALAFVWQGKDFSLECLKCFRVMGIGGVRFWLT